MPLPLLVYLPLASGLACLALGLLVLTRSPRSAVNRSFALGMAALTVTELAYFLALQSDSPASYVGWTKVSLAGEALLAPPWLAFSVSFGRSGPAGQLRRWRHVFVGVSAATVGLVAMIAFDRLVTDRLGLDGAGLLLPVFLLLVFTAILANFEFTFRSAGRADRWRIKHTMLGLAAIFVFLIFVLTQGLLFASAARDFTPLRSAVTLLGAAVVGVSLGRQGLLDVQVTVSRYVIYNSVTVLAVGAYLLAVGVAVQAVTVLGGDLAFYVQSLLVIVSGLLLAALLLSYNARKRLKSFIDRHFYPQKYDYRKEWLRLTERLSSKLEVDQLLPPLADLIFETFWIRRVAFWLADDDERAFRPIEPRRPAAAAPVALAAGMVRALKASDGALELDRPDLSHEAAFDTDAARLRALGTPILLPLVIEERLLGFLALSRPHAAGPLGDDDRELLKTMAKQVASSFLIARLLQRELRSRELETFHAMSTFLLHDLKNFVSMLSLVVQNMGRNHDNPEFRADALASISATVEKMKRLMERLASLGQSPDLTRVEVDLTAVVREALGEMRGSVGVRLCEDLQPVPPVLADAALFKKVVTNLVLNATEAVGPDGEVGVSTAGENGMAELRVWDNGCGMSREFLEHRLFRPFATTKSQGFGIGLYQTKAIVEAHGGRIEVESRPGEGTEFRVLIPLGRT